MKKSLSLILALVLLIGLLPMNAFATEETNTASIQNPFEGKKVSILSHSMSTYAGVSNNTAANSTIGSNDIYYTEGRLGVYQKDTWWQQVIDALDMELLVNNSWSGSCVFMPRKGEASVGYGDRAVNLHNDHTGEEPDIIFVYLGCNDFAYYKDTFGEAADVNYAALITDNGDDTFTYATPTTTCEAYAIMLHKVEHRYPDAEIYCMTSTARRETDYTEDSYPDAGQPTAYSAELQKVAQYFGYPVVDLENAITKDVETFDKYIGDKRAHANALGMDQISNAVLSVMLGRDAEICHVTSEDDTVQEQAVLLGGRYYTDVELQKGYSVVVTMNGEDITDEAYNNGKISIEEVTGDIAIIATRNPLNFLWEIQDDKLVSVGDTENALSMLAGTVAGGMLNDTRYKLATSAVLKHDLPWELEWQCAEDWQGVMLSSAPAQKTTGMHYLSRTKGGQLCFGTWTGQQYDNYGVDLSYLDDQTHTYRLVNRIATDGSNMVWLYVDGTEIGPMNNYYIGSKDQGATSDWLSGKDFVFSYIGMEGHPLNNCRLDYLRIQECVHTYENGICTSCGTEHPNLPNYNGKVISILGDSISTFAGYIPVADGFNLQHYARYPQDNLFTEVEHTWWMQVLTALDAKLGINESWRSTEVYNYIDAEVNSSYDGTKACMASITRIQNLGSNGTPDVILFFGGTNDITQSRPVGTFDPSNAPTEVDLTSVKWDAVADAYVDAIMRMQYYYPEAQIVAMLPFDRNSQGTAKVNQYNSLFISICEHYGVPYVDLRECGISNADLPDGTHPDATGMDYITAAVLDVLMSDCNVEAGEHIVHSVTHNLTDAKSSMSYYKGISHGKSFVTTITGEDVTVTVTMDGVDVTADCYANGVVSIANVTGDLVISATGIEKTIYEDYLQQLPENFCSGTNLWTALAPINLYYTGSGWGNTASGSVYSVTIPVAAGDQIWATSFQKSGTNGGSRNGIRLTWFDENGVLESVSPDDVYAEFSANSCVTAPDGAVAVNVVMWKNADSNEVYLLNRDHTYENGICTACGEAQPGPVITQQPANGEAKLGERFCVTVEAEGEGLTYQWYFRNAGSTVWHKSAVRDNTYDDVMTTARAGREIYCVITDANGNSVTTEIAKLICTPSVELEIVTQPTNGEAVLGERYCVTVEAKGDGLKYQWYFRNAGSETWYKSSVRDNTYDDVMTTARAGREVYCVITDVCGNSVTTDVVTLIRVPVKLEITSQPTDATAAFGETFCATVEAKGEGLKYQWYFRNAGSDTWHKSGVRDNTYDDIMTKARNGREIYCVITDAYGNTVTTDVVKLTAVPKVELKLLGQSYESAAMGENYCVTVNAQGEGLTYQWYFRNAGSSTWYKSSVKDNTYDDVMTKARANREVYCVITDAYGNQIVTEVVTLVLDN